MLTLDQRKARMDAMRTVADRMTAQLEGLTDAELTTPYMPDEWTIAQNVHHLADAQLNAYVRFKLLLFEEGPTLKTWQQDDWAKSPDAQSADVDSSLAIIRAVHDRWLSLMPTLTEDDWSRTGVHPENGTLTLDDLLDYYGRHGDMHIDQIAQVKEAMP